MNPTLETPRLIMRPFETSDAQAAHAWFGDPEVFRYYTYGPYSLDDTAKRIGEYIAQNQETGLSKWIVIEKSTGRPIGDAGLMRADHTTEIHVGYKLARSHWGMGFATEAAAAWVAHGFGELQLQRICAFIHSQNTPSIRVVQRLGFRRCRTDRESGIPLDVFELLKTAAIQS